MSKHPILTVDAPQAIGTYPQAIRAGATVCLSGQFGLHPVTMELVDGVKAQIRRVFRNLQAVAAGGSLGDTVKLNVVLTDLAHFGKVNEIMAQCFQQPYLARAAVGVAAPPRGAPVKILALPA